MKPVSDQLFAFENRGTPALTHKRCSAKDLGLEESWLRDAIFNVPDLVIGPCRAAGLTEDEWYGWQREYKVDVGKVDVHLVLTLPSVPLVFRESRRSARTDDEIRDVEDRIAQPRLLKAKIFRGTTLVRQRGSAPILEREELV